MDQNGKYAETENDQIDLSVLSWSDKSLYDFLKKKIALKSKEATTISKLLRTKTDQLETPLVTLQFMNELLESTLQEFGHELNHSIKLSKSIFVEKGLTITENARRVLERRYLKKRCTKHW